MKRKQVADNAGRFSLDIEVGDFFLEEAVENEHAEVIFQCANTAALAALAQGGSWPPALVYSLRAFMHGMKENVSGERTTAMEGPCRPMSWRLFCEPPTGHRRKVLRRTCK